MTKIEEVQSELVEARAEIEQMREALKRINSLSFSAQKIVWDYDGDCGATEMFSTIADESETALEVAEKGE